MSKSFENKKSLKFIITLGTGKFGSSDNNQITLEGFRAMVDIDKAGGVQMSTLRAKIYGVSESSMNSVTTLRWRGDPILINNRVEVHAIDGMGDTLVYGGGTIVNAWGDYRNMPDVFLHIQAQGGYSQQLQAVQPTSYRGQSDAAVVMEQIAKNMGYAFENNGVSVQLSDLYLANTWLEQAKEIARAAGIDMYLDDTTLAITPRSTPRSGQIPLISKDTGLVGYPSFDGPGVIFQTLFNSAITFGGAIQLDTDLAQAKGQWKVTSLSHRLESERPGGAWFSTVRGIKGDIAITR